MGQRAKQTQLAQENLSHVDTFNMRVVGPGHSFDRLLLVSSRALIAFIFVFSGIMKIFGWNQSLQYMAAKGMPAQEFFLVVAIALEIGAGLLVAFGRQLRLSAGLLFLYLIPTTLIFHDFWNLQGI